MVKPSHAPAASHVRGELRWHAAATSPRCQVALPLKCFCKSTLAMFFSVKCSKNCGAFLGGTSSSFERPHNLSGTP
eukprot:7351885-Pyramimonas_sp.AAC.1